MNRIDRLTAIIIYLQGRKRVRLEELAERYGISERTVYRDLSALQEAGVPIGSEPGSGYFIVRGYHLPPVMFDKKEAAALLAAERVMQKWSDTTLGESYQSALDKIRSVLRNEEKEYLDILDQHIKVLRYPDEKNKMPVPDRQVFVFMQDAIVAQEVVAIDYFSPYKEEHTQRDVEPLGLLLMESRWYLAGWCRLRCDYRMFRLERIKQYRKTGQKKSASRGSDHTLKKFYEQSLYKEENLHAVIVQFDREIVRYIGDQKYWHGWISEKETDGGVEMTFLTSSMEGFARWLLIWGNGVRIQSPERLKTRVTELVDELHTHHGNIEYRTRNFE